MPLPDLKAREEHRLSGQALCPQAKVPTYQELLDEALDNTFPASDPIAASAATHVHEPHTTHRDARDWTLKPGACRPVGQPCDDGAGCEVASPVPAFLVESLCIDAQGEGIELVPVGPCSIEQTAEQATLAWQEGHERHAIHLSLEDYRRLLSCRVLRREEPA